MGVYKRDYGKDKNIILYSGLIESVESRLLKLLRDLLSRFCAKFGGNQEDKSTFRKS